METNEKIDKYNFIAVVDDVYKQCKDDNQMVTAAKRMIEIVRGFLGQNLILYRIENGNEINACENELNDKGA